MAGLGFGIIGCGVIGPLHAKGIEACSDADLVAVCDIVEEKAKGLADQYSGTPEVYTDYHEMLKRDDLDVVCICTPSGAHAEQGIACAEAGKHVLTEKPIDVKLDAIDALIEACKSHSVKLGCIFQRRTRTVSHVVRDAVQSGRLGQMVVGDAYLKYYRSPEYYKSADWRATWKWDGGGALMNQGVHGIDLLVYLMGPVKTVTAHAAHLVRDIEVEDTAVAILQYENGAFGVLEGTTSIHPGLPSRHELHGDRGSIIMEESKILRWSIMDEEEEPPEVEQEAPKGGAFADPKAISGLGHILQIQDIADAVNEDREPLVPGEEARKAVELILAIYRSSETGETVSLALTD
ncbi:MAG: Gfo/Idh/MocA family oxidoreductase [Armatimonadota bacterium]|jgi:predicted dehydrogenase